MMVKPYGRTKVQENEDGKLLLGSGCETCPVIACATMTYRGSACASQRATHGLGDPMTNADRIRAMGDEELAQFLWSFNAEEYSLEEACGYIGICTCRKLEGWLKQPAGVDT